MAGGINTRNVYSVIHGRDSSLEKAQSLNTIALCIGSLHFLRGLNQYWQLLLSAFPLDRFE